jgi:hypothetical protein
VTSHQGQLQTLINEIEALLGKATPRLPWMVAGEANQQRRVLEQARNYLQTLQGQTDAPGGWGPVAPETGEIAPAGDAAQPTEASSQQVLQALLQEMQYLRSQTLQPLRSEVSLLQQQREQLQREVHQLELERLQIANSRASQPALNPALVDEVVRRLQESLLSQLNPQIQALQAQVNDPAALYGQIESDLADPNALPQLHPSQRLEQLRRIQSQTDYMLLKLDTNLRAVFESMEQSIQSYRDSLHQGLDTMHGLGQQGEVIFKALINHLAQQLGQNPYLEARASEASGRLSSAEDRQPPVYGMESQESWLDGESRWQEDSAAPGQPPLGDELLSEAGDLPSWPDELDADEFNIDDLDLDADLDFSEDEEITIFQLDEEITQLQLDAPEAAADLADKGGDRLAGDSTAFQDDDATVIQREPIPWPVDLGDRTDATLPALPSTEGSESTLPTTDDDAENADIDALYESLFGNTEAEGDVPASDSADSETVDAEDADTDERSSLETSIDDALLSTDADGTEDGEESADDGRALEDTVADLAGFDELTLPELTASAMDEEGGELGEDDTPPLANWLFSGEAADADEMPGDASAPLAAEQMEGEDGSADAPSSLASLFGEAGDDELDASPPDASLEANTIASLADLLPTPGASHPEPSTAPFWDQELGEDSFIAAPPDEDLLTVDDPAASPAAPDLDLSPTALEQLNADLRSLEALPPDQWTPEPPGLDAMEEDTAAAATDDEASIAAADVAPPEAAATVTGEELFADGEPVIAASSSDAEDAADAEDPADGEDPAEDAATDGDVLDSLDFGDRPDADALDRFDSGAAEPGAADLLATETDPDLAPILDLPPIASDPLGDEPEETPEPPTWGATDPEASAAPPVDLDWDSWQQLGADPAESPGENQELLSNLGDLLGTDAPPPAPEETVDLASLDQLGTAFGDTDQEAPHEDVASQWDNLAAVFGPESPDDEAPTPALGGVDDLSDLLGSDLLGDGDSPEPAPAQAADASLADWDQGFGSPDLETADTDADDERELSLADMSFELDLPPIPSAERAASTTPTADTESPDSPEGAENLAPESLDDLLGDIGAESATIDIEAPDSPEGAENLAPESLDDLLGDIGAESVQAEASTTAEPSLGWDELGAGLAPDRPSDDEGESFSLGDLHLDLELDGEPEPSAGEAPGPEVAPPETLADLTWEDTSSPARPNPTPDPVSSQALPDILPELSPPDPEPAQDGEVPKGVPPEAEIELFPTATDAEGSIDEALDLDDDALEDLFPPTGFTPSPLTDAEVNPTLELDQILAPDPLPLSDGADTEADTPVEETPPTLEDLDDFFPSDGPDAPAAAWDAQSEETIQTLENLEDFLEPGPMSLPDLSQSGSETPAVETAPTLEDLDDFLTPDPLSIPEVAAPTPAAPAPTTDPTAPAADASVAADHGDATPATAALLAIADPTEPSPPGADTAEAGGEWFLGLDLGTTGLSAVLMNRADGQAYPLYWTDAGLAGATTETIFRLPATVSLRQTATGWQPQTVGAAALTVDWAGETGDPPIVVNQLKPLLALGLPHHDQQGSAQPQVQWSEQQPLPLAALTTALTTLLKTVQVQGAASAPVGAAGLTLDELATALQQLQGVIVGYPAQGSDTYRLNVREAILATQWVTEPSQVFFVDEAIAAVLSGLPDPHQMPDTPSSQSQTLYQCPWQGGTVVVCAGAAVTELGVADLPQPLAALTGDDFALRTLAYGGDALDLDIISHLLAPAERRQTRPIGQNRATTTGWHWEATLPPEADAHWASLGLDSLDLPRLAEPDRDARVRLRRRLESSPLGQSLLEAARHLKLILQNQAQFHLELGDQSWRVLRRDLENRILVPYIQRINQNLNALMSQTGLSAQGIKQVVCTGGNASFNTIAKWLRQKFPNATIIQDTYPTQRPASCSRVAYGLVNLCRYPQALDGPRHQYSDYFLLQEILRVAPDQPMPLSGLLHLLEEQGVNTEVCQQRIVALLEGHLPPGLGLDAGTRSHLSPATLDTPLYRALATESLFSHQSRQIYVLNSAHRQRLQQHLANLMADKQQSLTEPLMAQLVLP